MQVTLIGLGCGRREMMTAEALEALSRADVVIGAKRLLESVPENYGKIRAAAFMPQDIMKILLRYQEDAAVVYSGDTGFYSGTRGLLPLLKKEGISYRILPGISSVQLFSARLGRTWQDWNLFSAHGTACDPVAAVMQGKPSFFLTGGELTPDKLLGILCEAGLQDLPVTIGENLSYENEKITEGTAGELVQQTYAPLSVMLAEPVPQAPCLIPGIPDDCFIRGDVPMTKREVRASILSHLAVRPGETVWDIGAGTGSVSIELSQATGGGHVYAVECMERACDLILANRKKFGAFNLHVETGKAEDVIGNLPKPDAVFIGGSRGQMESIVRGALQKNPGVRICISAIAVETLGNAAAILAQAGMKTQIIQISVSESRQAGRLHLMMAENPIFLICGNCI